MDNTYVSVTEAAHVTDTILTEVIEVVDGWYSDSRIEWDEVWDRMERGSNYDFGNDNDSPAMRKIKRYVRAQRAL